MGREGANGQAKTPWLRMVRKHHLYKFPCRNQRVVLTARFCNEHSRPVAPVFNYFFIMRRLSKTELPEGKNCVLLGGVYTLPKYRNCGLAKALLNGVTQQFAARAKKCTLFVRTQNLAAIKVYEKTGFKKFCNFEIIYYWKVNFEGLWNKSRQTHYYTKN